MMTPQILSGQSGHHWHIASCIHCCAQIGMVECELDVKTCGFPFESAEPLPGLEPVTCSLCSKITYVDYGNRLKEEQWLHR